MPAPSRWTMQLISILALAGGRSLLPNEERQRIIISILALAGGRSLIKSRSDFGITFQFSPSREGGRI